MARSWGSILAGLSWDLILTSDLGRARETAGLINSSLNLPVYEEPRLQEQDWGRWSGLTLESLRANQVEALRAQEQAGWDFRPPDGETRMQTLLRSKEALLQAGQRWPGKNILVVCHEGVIKCLLYHLTGRLFLPQEPRLLNKGYFLHTLTVTPQEIRLTTLHHKHL